MLTIDPKKIPVPQLHRILLGGVGPRPIAFASTVDGQGNRNLAPFSFFNVFSANPPVLIFSPARSGRTNTNKDTFHNILEVPEVVINVVTFDMVNQMSLASSPYDKDVDEFVKSGFTPLASQTVKPSRVKESPVQFECNVFEVKELGKSGGAGNLIFCEVNTIHIDEAVLDHSNMIDQQKIDLVSRMGGNWYSRTTPTSMFEIDKPISSIGVGVDALPDSIRLSHFLSGNDLGKLGTLGTLPTSTMIHELLNEFDGELSIEEAKNQLDQNNISLAYAILVQSEI